MNGFKIRHGRLTPPGNELVILRKLPRAALACSVLIGVIPALARIWPQSGSVDALKNMKTVDIFAIATEVTLLTGAFTVAIGCAVVHVMKGPAYIADPLPVSHADEPVADEQTAHNHRR